MNNKKYREKHKEHLARIRDVERFDGLRTKVLERDNFKCIKCGMTNKQHYVLYARCLTIDHIDGKGRNQEVKNNDLSNLQTLCLVCHGKKDHRPKKMKFDLWSKENLTMEDVREVVKKIKPIKKQRIDVSNKHYQLLKKQLEEAVPKNSPCNNLASMYGITIFIKPYLKKIRIYAER